MLWSACFLINLSRSFRFSNLLLLFVAIRFDLHAAVFFSRFYLRSDWIRWWCWRECVFICGRNCAVFFFFLIRSSISFWRFFFNWKVVWIVKLGINRSKEKWGWHSRSFSAGFSRRRKCEFWWLVLMLLVRPLSSTSSSSERSLLQFLPLVSF